MTQEPPTRRSGMKVLAVAALLGAVSVLGFAPFNLFPLPIATLAVMVALWQGSATRGRAAWLGFVFGLGYFISGVSWVYVSLHDFGAMPPLLAGVLTLAFCAILAVYPALTGWIYHALGARSIAATLAAWPALWVLGEWLRGWVFTGFPWITVGYSQVPLSPLAGYLPVLGVYGASYATALTAAGLVVLWRLAKAHAGSIPARFTSAGRHPVLALLAALWIGGAVLRNIEWTHAEGEPITVSLLQGNIPQEMKWREDRLRATLVTYRSLVMSTSARLTVLPETALPLFLHEVPQDYLDGLAEHARGNGGDVLIGIPERTDARHYYNSVLSLGSAPSQTYRKSHLVPFGEFIPLKVLFGWFFAVAQIPLLDFSRGDINQQPLAVGGLKVAINVCYEDAFGEEIIRQLPQATLLVNVSNVAWFGRSIAPQQHLQISQARALETGRYMLRATNTGMTAIIDQAGRVLKVAPEFTTSIVSGEVHGYAGATPYVRWGNAPVVVCALALAIAGGWLARRRTGNIRDLPRP